MNLRIIRSFVLVTLVYFALAVMFSPTTWAVATHLA
jgi:hypothetical protein